MLVSDFDFELPQELIAQRPAEPRDSSRLLVYERKRRTVEHTVFRRLPKFLAPGDLLVLNNTKVLPWRLAGRLPTGGRMEVLILGRRGKSAYGFVKPARKLRAEQPIPLEDSRLELVPLGVAGPEPGTVAFELRVAAGVEASLDDVIASVGRAPLPPYIRREHVPGQGAADRLRDLRDYQTVYAQSAGAVAAPTAGLHFTEAVFDELGSRAVERAMVTLHVGAGTFAPVRVDTVEDHEMHAERFELSAETAAAVGATRRRGGRVVAVGTTSARVLESSATEDRLVRAGSGTTDLFLYPGRELRVADALLTNFHLPQSTLLMLLAAVVGFDEWKELYRTAVAERYRFFLYGDAMLIL